MDAKNGARLIMVLLVASAILPFFSGASQVAYSQLPAGQRLGFWTSEDAELHLCPQQFFNGYFLSTPYPATTVFTSGLSFPTTSCGGNSMTQAQWVNSVATLADSYPNIEIVFSMFINLSGYSVFAGSWAPSASTGYVNTGFSIARASPLTVFTLTSAAGLAPLTTYTLQLLDINLHLIGNIATFTTDSTGAASVTAGVPNTTDAQANEGGYVVIQGTHVGSGRGWMNDQTADFTNYVNAFKGHRSIYGLQLEQEYYGYTSAEIATFNGIVTGAGYIPVILGFSAYPTNGGAIQTGANNAVMTYGLYVSDCPDAYTQAAVQSIVDTTGHAPMTVINQDVLSCPQVGQYVWSDPNYQVNYLLSTTPGTSTTATTSTGGGGPTTTTVTATTSTRSPFPFLSGFQDQIMAIAAAAMVLSYLVIRGGKNRER